MGLLVAGIGDGGGAALTHVRAARLRTVRTLAINTTVSEMVDENGTGLLIGESVTGGLGTAGDPRRGRDAAEASKDALFQKLAGVDHLYLAAGLGAGTGSGAAPVVGFVGRELSIPTTAVVTLPFTFESASRRQIAGSALSAVRWMCDTVIVIDANSLSHFLGTTVAMDEAFSLLQRAVAWAILARIIEG